MNFSWDENKAASNFEKHGIRFEEAMLVFADPYNTPRKLDQKIAANKIE